MVGKTSQDRFWALLAVVAALTAIVAGALYLLAPVWQPGYRPKGGLPEPEGVPPAAPEEAAPGEESAVPATLDINTATAEELTALPGIGASRAAAIVNWREEHGPFAALDDLAQIDGISARMVEGWRDLAHAG